MKHREYIRTIVAGACVCLVCCVADCLADRGMIRPRVVGDVNVEEPAQRAIIAHNGSDQLLILQTDVKADRAMKIVEFMPLPSKPTVSLAPKTCFAALADIVREHRLRYYTTWRGRGRGKGAEKAEEAVSVVVSAQLGPHDVTVVEVKDVDAFVKWVRDFFQQKKLGEPMLEAGLKRIVSDYLKRRLRFFAFDVVAVSPQTKTVQPLTYAFKTDKVYYPLKVTNLYGHAGVVELFLILPDGVSPTAAIRIRPAAAAEKPPDQRNWRFLRSRAARLKLGRLAKLHPRLPKLMGHDTAEELARAHLYAVKYQGPLVFDSDLMVGVEHETPFACVRAFIAALNAGSMDMLGTLVDVPFAFDRKQVFKDKKAVLRHFARVLEKTKGRGLKIDTLSVGQARGIHGPPNEWFNKDKFLQDFINSHPRKDRLRLAWLSVGGERMIVLALPGKTSNRHHIVGFAD